MERNAIVSISTFYPNQPSCVAAGFLLRWGCRIFVVTAAHDVLFTAVTDPNNPIWVGVYNVNGRGRSRVFRAEIVGVDATADVGVLRLRGRGTPRVGRHPTIALQTRCRAGDRVVNLSSPLNRDRNSFVEGTVRSVSWFDNSGQQIVGCLLTNLLVYGASSGSPVLHARTRRCVGLVSFGFATGFCGGCGSHTLRRILRNVLGHRNVQKVPEAPSEGYVSNLKGYLGPVQWVGVDSFTLTNLYPQNASKLEMRGFILTATSPDSPLSNLLHGAPPLQAGDIVVWGQHDGRRLVFGEGLSAVGDLLWWINPRRGPVVKFGIIRHPATNSRLQVVEARLDLSYNPATETPPVSGLPEQQCPSNPAMLFTSQFNGPGTLTLSSGSYVILGANGEFINVSGPLPINFVTTQGVQAFDLQQTGLLSSFQVSITPAPDASSDTVVVSAFSYISTNNLFVRNSNSIQLEFALNSRSVQMQNLMIDPPERIDAGPVFGTMAVFCFNATRSVDLQNLTARAQF
jgi:hypothetical protein